MYLVFDLGGTFIKHSIITGNAEIITKNKVGTPYRMGKGMPGIAEAVEAFMEIIGDIYDMYKKDYDIQGIAVSMPGLVDVDNGIVRGGGALPYLDGTHLADMISERCDGLKVALENDGKCAALAEIWMGNAKDCKNAIVMVFGTGIGGGIVVNRRIIHGKGMVAGEMSLYMERITLDNVGEIMPLEENVKKGNKNYRLPDGCLWTMNASVSAIIRDVANAKGLDQNEVNGELIYKWDEEGDVAVHRILEGWYLDIAKHCLNLYATMAPDIILLGGGVSSAKGFFPGVLKYVEALSKVSIIYDDITVGLCKFGNDSNLLGALFNYLQKYEGAK
jgi:predicted NBD/HSP70 family sugar kinase